MKEEKKREKKEKKKKASINQEQITSSRVAGPLSGT